MSSRSELRRRVLDWGIIAVFLALIAAPTVDRFVRPDSARGPEPERRKPAPKPEWELSSAALAAYPERFRAWFDDSFGLRDVLLRWNSIVKVFLLRTSPSRDLVLGKDDWWLYRGFRALDDWRGTIPFETTELEAWKRMLEANRDDLRRRGIEYLFVIGPNKETIYPEKVPERLNRVGPTRLDQLLAYLGEHSDVRILDLRPALLAAKRDDAPGDELYYKNGTHWNARGVLVACSEIVRRLAVGFPTIEAIDPSAVERPVCPDLDSWAPTMYIPDLVPPSARYCKVRAPRARVVQRTGPESNDRCRITEVEDAKLPSAVLVHDSYGESLDLVLPESFRRLAAYWGIRAELTDVDRERPDVFIQLYVERSLALMSPETYRIRAEGCERPSFDRSTKRLFRLDPSAAGAQLSTIEDSPLSRGTDAVDAGLSWRVAADRSALLLPKLEFPPDADAVLAIDLDAPAATQIALLDEDAVRSFSARKAIAPVDAGRNHLYVRLAAGSIRGRLAIRPGIPGAYRIRDLEIRLVEPAAPAPAPVR
jgi:hypothetical protein